MGGEHRQSVAESGAEDLLNQLKGHDLCHVPPTSKKKFQNIKSQKKQTKAKQNSKTALAPPLLAQQ